MMEQLREAERTRTGLSLDNLARPSRDYQAFNNPLPTAPSSDEIGTQTNAVGEIFELPIWLRGMRQLRPAPGATVSRSDCGSPCCLFYPLDYCSLLHSGGENTIVNGFCKFHLYIIFNITYTVDKSFEIDDVTQQAAVFMRLQNFVAYPQPVSNEYTAVFPFFEMFNDPPRIEEIKLYNLHKALITNKIPQWQKIYSQHINYLHSLITLTSPDQPPNEGMEKIQLLYFWEDWNKYNSQYLIKNPSNHVIYYSEDGNTIRGYDISGFTALTQLIIRLFAVPYAGFTSKNFLSVPSNYNFNITKHLAYTNNLCSQGTFYKDGAIIGNMATLSMVYKDVVPPKTTYIYKQDMNCPKQFCLDTKIKNKDSTPILNKAQIIVNTNP